MSICLHVYHGYPLGLMFLSNMLPQFYCKIIILPVKVFVLAWGQECKSYLEKFLKLQKRALRFIYFSEQNQHSIRLFIDAGVLPLKFFVL